ncbi:MAG: nodulation protein NodZ [Sulfuricurvum sp.]|nr:nodulation protein NodZ [Sulfuricurvum sp.]
MNTKEFYWKSIETFRDITGSLDNKMKPFYCPLQQRQNHGIYAVNINAKVGFFAQLNWCLYIFANCERFNLRPIILLTSPFYVRSKGESWLDYFFENRKLTTLDRGLIDNRSVKFSHISDFDQLGLPADYGSTMSLEYANQLLWNHLTIKSEIMNYVESFVDEHFGKRATLGIHYRGTDKKSEAKQVPWEYAAATISNYLDANPQVDSLFVASDEESFIEWIKREFKDIGVISHNDTERSMDGKAIHTQSVTGDNYMKGKEALINSMLLSKCDALIRTSSFLSAWSSIFNPCLPVIMLNRPFDDKLWFPDALLTQKSLDGYLPNQI